MEWYNALDPILKVYWTIALITSLIFLIQAIMTFVGMDSSDGVHADFDGNMDIEAPFQLFSLRNLINFLLGYGWAGVCFYEKIESTLWLSFAAIGTGLVFVILFFFLMSQVKRLARDNSFRIEETFGRIADVYLSIPAEKKGKGKIQISVRGAYHEIEAMTAGDRIPTGAKVKVETIIDSQTVLVSPIG